MAATALLHEERVETVSLVDIAPFDYNLDPWIHDDPLSTCKILNQIAALDLGSLESPAAADKQLAAAVEDRSTRQFLLQNLVQDKQTGALGWRCNLEALRAGLEDAQGFPFEADLAARGPVTRPALVVRGTQARFVSTEAHMASIHRYFGDATVDSLDGGHWLHISHRNELADIIGAFLQKNS